MRRSLIVSLVGAALVLAGLSPAGAAPTEGDSPERPTSRRFHLECQLERLETGPAVACKWAHLSGAATYRLARAERGEPREFIHRGDETSFVDTDVAPGHKYVYRVQALRKDPRKNVWSSVGRAGRWSNVARVAVPSQPNQPMRLACRSVVGPAVACEWSNASNSDIGTAATAGVPVPAPAPAFRLLRWGPEDRRTVVYQGPEAKHLDKDVATGRRYLYQVQSRDADGKVIGSSRAVKVAVPPVKEPPTPLPIDPVPADPPVAEPQDRKPTERPTPKPADRPVTPRPADRPATPKPGERPVEQLRLTCQSGDVTDGRVTEGRAATAVCEWSASSSDQVAGYRLWRAGQDEARHVVFESRTETRFVDAEVRPGGTYAYAVAAVDAEGRVIGHSETVRLKVAPPKAETRVEKTSNR